MVDMRSIALRIETSAAKYEHEGIRYLTVESVALLGRADISLWIPEAALSLTSVPIVILLHGVYGSHWSWFLQGGVHRVAGEMMREGKLRPVVIACPSDGLEGEGSGYLPAAERNFERWICDVPAIVASTVSCCDARSKVFLGGLSMGGYGSLRIGAKYPHLFAAISAHSPITTVEQFRLFMRDAGPFLQEASGDWSVLRWMKEHAGNLPPIRFDCGSDDPLLAGAETLHSEMIEEKIAHSFERLDGDHSWSYWNANIHRSLRFFENVML